MTEDVKNILYELKTIALSMHQSAANLADIVSQIETGIEPKTDPEYEKYITIAYANNRLDHIKYRYEDLKERELTLWQMLKDEYKKES